VGYHEENTHEAAMFSLRLYGQRAGDQVLYLMADSSLSYRVIDDALAIARGAGVRVVGAVTEGRGR
jgi:biopolymer transport protein ExbD